MAAKIDTIRLFARVAKQYLNMTGPLVSDSLNYMQILITEILATESLPSIHCVQRPKCSIESLELAVSIAFHMQVKKNGVYFIYEKTIYKSVLVYKNAIYIYILFL